MAGLFLFQFTQRLSALPRWANCFGVAESFLSGP